MNADENMMMIVHALLGIQLYGVQKEAADFICASVSKWTNTQYEKGYTLPIMKDGECIKPATPTPSGENPREIDEVLLAAQLENRTDLKARIARIEALEKSLMAFRSTLNALTPDEIARLDLVQPNWEWDTNVRVVSALGLGAAFNASIAASSTSIKRILREEREKLAKVAKSRGRARSEAAYGVALTFAQLYSIVTGKRPTFAENENGLHGEFTPYLADLFKIFGWGEKSMKRPAEEALKSLDYEAIRSARIGKIGLMGSFLNSL